MLEQLLNMNYYFGDRWWQITATALYAKQKKSIHRYDGVCFGTTRKYIMNKHHNSRIKIKKKNHRGSLILQLEK